MVARTQDVLTATIQELLGKGEKQHRPLAGKMRLAYNPNPAENIYRLVLSCPDDYPPEVDLEVVRGTLVQVLRRLGRPLTDVLVQPYLSNHKYKYHVIEWREYRQLSLLPLPGGTHGYEE
ncbi:MAG: hypothetical protein KF770_28550 [Anaerolineae bacterium]|nr:hypothetical protein [Anaerolineae bacterium]